MDNNYKNRWKAVGDQNRKKSDDFFSVWEDQRQMQAEDERIAKELVEAKKRARELKKTLYKHKFGEQKEATFKVIKNTTNATIKQVKNANTKIRNHKKHAAISAIVLVVFLSGLIIINSRNKPTETLGDNTTKLTINDDLPREKPAFTLLYPSGKNESNYDVVRISPPEADASYTYLDRFSEDSQIFRVTQQEIPDGFNLEEAATGFQATSIIDVDGNRIYHGYSESGGIQSLLFIKDDKLILIRSTQKFSDDQWASYYVSLK